MLRPAETFVWSDGLPTEVKTTVAEFIRRRKELKNTEEEIGRWSPVDRDSLGEGIFNWSTKMVTTLKSNSCVLLPEARDVMAVVLVGSCLEEGNLTPRDVDLCFVYDNPPAPVRTDMHGFCFFASKIQGRVVDAYVAGIKFDPNNLSRDEAIPWVVRPHKVICAPNLSLEQYQTAKRDVVDWLFKHPTEVEERIK